VHEIERGELRAPARVLDIDITRSIDAIADVERFATAWCLIRQDGEAVATRFFDIQDDSSINLSAVYDSVAAPPS
jgi:hypothetical protein